MLLLLLLLPIWSFRQTTKDVVLGGYQVPKGTLLFLSLGGMHTSPFNFAEPGKFKPVGWVLPLSLTSNEHKLAALSAKAWQVLFRRFE